MFVLPRLTLAVAALVLGAPATAQSVAPPQAPALPNADASDDIVVSALRIPRDALPTAVYWTNPSILSLRTARERSDLFMRCAVNITDEVWLRRVIDGEPNGARARVAQQQIGERAQGCFPPDRAIGAVFGNNPLTVTEAQTTVDLIDRAAIVEQALRRFAPDAELTAAEVNDEAVRSRFEAREGYRNRLRLANDRGALVLSYCLVREQPVLATRLIRSTPGSQLEQGLTQALLIEARSCIGNAKRVTIDPTLMRAYVADAFYRWVVAVRGVDTLIPQQIASR